MKQHQLTRRDFTKWMGWGALATALPATRVLGANETIRIAALGVGSKGRNNAGVFRNLPGVRLVVICDPDQNALQRCQQELQGDTNLPPVKTEIDYHRILERKDIDAVCISTPNHWHSLMAIQACQAGKDVYVEKPICHTPWEGRQLVKAAIKYDRIVQGGTQNRSDTGLREFYEWLKDKPLGNLTEVRGLCCKPRKSIGKRDTPLPPPDSLDYNLWLGPAADIPVYRPNFHYDWHWFWHTGNGDTGNQGPHEFNQMTWTLGDEILPQRVTSFGGRFGWRDAGQTPNIQFMSFELANGIPAYFETRNMSASPESDVIPYYEKIRVGLLIRFEGGYFKGGRGGGWIYDNSGQRIRQFKGDGGGTHQANFIEAMRARKTSLLRSPIHQNLVSDTWMHIANISQRLGHTYNTEELKERMQGHAAAEEACLRLSNEFSHWNIDTNRERWQGGVTLDYDAQAGQFTGPLADQANALLHRQDRKGFTVPDEV